MWIATAQTVEHGGFGTAGVETNVEIKTATSGSHYRVLSFADGGGDIRLNMHWDGPAHLVVVYDADPELLYFQVVRTSGIDISVQDISTRQQQGFHPSARP
jgi:hypothetical protein